MHLQQTRDVIARSCELLAKPVSHAFEGELEEVRAQIAECEMIRDLATDVKKRELFARRADDFKVLAAEIEKKMTNPTTDTFLGRKTYEPFPRIDADE